MIPNMLGPALMLLGMAANSLSFRVDHNRLPAPSLPAQAAIEGPERIEHRNFIGGVAHSFGGSILHPTRSKMYRIAKRYQANAKRCKAIREGTHLTKRELKALDRERQFMGAFL